jgi:hypothetical protein
MRNARLWSIIKAVASKRRPVMDNADISRTHYAN